MPAYMVDRERLVELIRQQFVGAVVEARDLTGTRDHYDVRVVWSGFEGMAQLARHRAVYAALRSYFSGDIHALGLKTLTPDELA